jgi:UDP-N-acetylmuramate--alanine ligase
MVGIGGAGMSAVARILLDRGGQVSGSDAKDSRTLLSLRARGAKVQVGHSIAALDLLPDGPTAVIASFAAIPQDNPELTEARRRDIPILLRPEVLARLMRGYCRILVAGTHGKTSTTSMLVAALQHSGCDPSFAVGGQLGDSGSNAHIGSGSIFVAEADESDGSLLQYDPEIAIVTNVEADHLDFFGTAEAYVDVFDSFAQKIVPGGVLVACLDDPGARSLVDRIVHRRTDIQVLGYSSIDPHSNAGSMNFRQLFAPVQDVPQVVRLLEYFPRAVGSSTRIHIQGEMTDRVVELSVPGKHMALNALAAITAARAAGAEIHEVIEGLDGYAGVHRRFQFVGREHGVRVFDDYAHHPTEVRAVLTAANQLVHADNSTDLAESTLPELNRVIVVFQPHLYSRTKAFAEEFATALSLADQVFVLDVYGARELPIPGVSGALIAREITKPVKYEPDMSQVARQVAAQTSPGDVVITMGAGDVTMLTPQILDALASLP